MDPGSDFPATPAFRTVFMDQDKAPLLRRIIPVCVLACELFTYHAARNARATSTAWRRTSGTAPDATGAPHGSAGTNADSSGCALRRAARAAGTHRPQIHFPKIDSG